jgi:hypothetical protein
MTDPIEIMAEAIRAMSLHEREAIAVSRTALSALTEAGFAIVPVTPTEDMVRAGNSQRGHVIGTPYRVWSAMIEAGSVKA